MTSHEILESMKDVCDVSELKVVFSTADLVKFAKYSTDANGMITCARSEIWRDFAKILNEIKQGENVIVETTNMSSEHINALKNEINKIGLKTNVIFLP